MKIKSKEFSFILPLYGIRFSVVIGTTMKQAVKELNKVYKDLNWEVDPTAAAQALNLETKNKCNQSFVMLLQTKKYSIEDIRSFIAHEALHLSWFICDYLGIELGPQGSQHEAQAYILEHIFFEADKALTEFLKN